MEKYESPKMEVAEFEIDDVITASGTGTGTEQYKPGPPCLDGDDFWD